MMRGRGWDWFLPLDEDCFLKFEIYGVILFYTKIYMISGCYFFLFFSGLYNLYEGGASYFRRAGNFFLITGGGGQKGRTYMFGLERYSRI